MKNGMYETAAEAIEAIRTLQAERKAEAEARRVAFYARFATEEEAIAHAEFMASNYVRDYRYDR